MRGRVIAHGTGHIAEVVVTEARGRIEEGDYL